MRVFQVKSDPVSIIRPVSSVNPLLGTKNKKKKVPIVNLISLYLVARRTGERHALNALA